MMRMQSVARRALQQVLCSPQILSDLVLQLKLAAAASYAALALTHQETDAQDVWYNPPGFVGEMQSQSNDAHGHQHQCDQPRQHTRETKT
jgi:hypothetical protein